VSRQDSRLDDSRDSRRTTADDDSDISLADLKESMKTPQSKITKREHQELIQAHHAYVEESDEVAYTALIAGNGLCR
jgi:hypothetical protein